MDFPNIQTRINSEQLHYLTGPIVHQSWQWSPLSPDWLIKAIPEQRLSLVLSEIQNGEHPTATDEEACIILYETSLDGPVSEDYASIYEHLVYKLMRKHNKAAPDAGVEVISNFQLTLLNRIKSQIRNSVVKHCKKIKHGKKT